MGFRSGPLPMDQIWTRNPAFFPLLGVALHWFASEAQEIAGGTLYVAAGGADVWGFVSDDLLVAGYERGPIADLLSDAEKKISELRGAVSTISQGDGLDVRFVAKRSSGSWRWIL